MKIAIISSVLPYHGGMGRVLDCEAQELYKNNIDFTVFAPDYGRRVDVDYKIEYLKPAIKIGFGAVCLDLLKKIKNGDFDIIYIQYPAYGLAEQILFLSKKNKKIFLRYHMDVIGDSMFKKIFFKIHNKTFLPLILSKVDKIFFSTIDYGRSSYAKNYIYKSAELPFGVDRNKFYFNNQIKKENQIFFISKLDKQHYFKGLDNLLVAFSNIKYKDITFKIIGEGDMLNYYKDKANLLNINNRVEFLGYKTDDEVRSEYQKSIVTILPSIDKSEAFGLVLIESIACGTPIIASDLPGVRTIVNDSRFICRINDTNSIKEAMEKIIEIYKNNIDEYTNIQTKYLNDVKDKYTWQNVLKIFK